MSLTATKPILLTITVCIILSSALFAQQAQSYTYRRNPAIGLHYDLSNFSRSPFEVGQLNHGYALSFLDGVSGRYDYMVQGGSISAKYALGTPAVKKSNLLHFLNLYGMRRFFADTVLFNPLLAAGPGIQLYDGRVNLSLAGGAGLQLRVAGNIFIHTQVSYHWYLSPHINNGIAASVGLLGTILQRKRRTGHAGAHTGANGTLPLRDQDGDSIPDSDDACPTVAGPRSFNGCPDTDGDGLPDNKDHCPTEPGSTELNGCPPASNKSAVILSKVDTLLTNSLQPMSIDRVAALLNELARFIYFDVDQATLTPASSQSLEKIATMLKWQPFKRLQIEGHTDNSGTTARNKRLSEARAQTVLDYLANAGIGRQQMRAKGFGASRPVADNTTPEGRAKNRRTVFVLEPQ